MSELPLKTAYSNLYKKEIYYFGGIFWRSTIFIEGVKEVLNSRREQEDIWICTYPKSGTVWARLIIESLLNKGILPSRKDFSSLPIELLNPEERKSILTSSFQQIIVTHLTHNLFPKNVLQRGTKVIYVIRNPKDIAVSFYHFIKIIVSIQYQGTWNEYFPFFVSGEVGYGCWFDHVLDWWKNEKNNPNILFIKFEDMKKNLSKVTHIISHFIGYPVSESEAAAIADECEFANVRKSDVDKVIQASLQFNATQHFFRKGDVGDWKNYFNEEQNKMFDKLFEEKMKDSDLTIEFEI